ncbi:hypothetical protein OESDEN_17577 [Oesophagostomum dentatum]|uniref:Uncharacterized protein n=1 Tax=Oesophagostomum dentatum TaxID=61180 RepID=A0A0B1SBQ7_OESDE|nr:hypothetical protein OESDEN_17577 [Oesophagostomum dentatum]
MCVHDRPALLIYDNPYLQQFYLPPNIELSMKGIPIRLELNPLLPTSYLLTLQEHCPHCEITQDIVFSFSECGLAGTQYTVEQFLQACANKRIIRAGFGRKIELYATDISEHTMNALCAKAEYMEVCITIKRSTYKSLICPNLKVLRPCKPGKKVFNPFYLR